MGDKIAAGDEKDGGVSNADGEVVRLLDGVLAEENNVSDGGESNTTHCESISVLNAIRPPGTSQGQDRSADVNGNGVNLGARRAVSKVVQDGWDEEYCRVSSCGDTDVNDSSAARLICGQTKQAICLTRTRSSNPRRYV